MKQYLKNLFAALLNANPFQAELERIREEYEKTADKVISLDIFYKRACEELESTRKKVEEYQRLIENLRESLEIKDKKLKCAREHHAARMQLLKERIEELTKGIEELKNNISR